MNDVQAELSSLVADFIGKVTDLARRAAVDTLHGALGTAPGLIAGAARGRGKLKFELERPKGAKRPPGELVKLQEKVAEFIAANPGLRIEQINKQMGTSTRALALPLRKLIATGQIHTKGEKRATTYFPGEGGKEAKPRRKKS
jgi:hypothetical protein